MNATRPRRTVNHRSLYTLRQAAWTLGVSADDLAAAIRRGTIRTTRRRSTLYVTGAELARHLPHATDNRPPSPSGNGTRWLDTTLDALARYRAVPTAVLAETVIRDCDCLWPHHDEPPPDGDTDREIAALACAGCRSRHACLELELRLAGDDTLGVWGGLCEQDRRALHRAWTTERDTPEPTDHRHDEVAEGWVR